MTAVLFTRAREAILARHQTLRFADVLREAYRVCFVPKATTGRSFDTACWCYDAKGRTHIISFGEALAEKQEKGQIAAYALAHYDHELEHSLSTERDLKAVAKRAADAGIPFRLVNLAEDARIEEISRQRWRKKLGWLDFEAAATGDEPVQLLFQIIQAEGIALGDHLIGPRIAGHNEVTGVYARVRIYYERFLAAADTWAVVSILREWIADFGVPAESETAARGDLEQALAAIEDPAAMLALTGEQAGEKNAGPTTAGDPNFALSGTPAHMDAGLVDRLISILRRCFAEGVRKVSSDSPAKRISLSAITRGSTRVFRKREIARRGSPKRVVVYYDCSGSMGCATIAGRHLVAALGNLAESGFVEGHIVLTKGDGDAATHLVAHLRDLRTLVARIPSDGSCECFEPALEATTRLLTPGTLVLAYTDGRITDTPIARGRWHRRGVYSIGLYVGPDQSARLHEWFDSAMCSENVEDLARLLGHEFRHNSGR